MNDLFNLVEIISYDKNDTKKWNEDINFKSNHRKNIDNILKSLYEPYGHWELNRKSKMRGVMYLPWEKESWSILNKINTNYSSLAVLLNSINEELVNSESNIDQFDFFVNKFGTLQFDDEYDRFIEYLRENKKDIFLKLKSTDETPILDRVINSIDKTSGIGNKAENVVIKYLSKIKNIENVYTHKGDGNRNDMFRGQDIKFSHKGKNKSAQVKFVKRVENINDYYIAIGSSFSTKYNTDLLIFVDNQFIFIFNNSDLSKSKINKNGELIFKDVCLFKKIELSKEDLTLLKFE